MKLAVDAYYFDENRARVVGVLFREWRDPEPAKIIATHLDSVQDYEPGSFYKRELPCILKLLEQVNPDEIDAIVVDGYVYLDENGKKGLGAYLYEGLNRKIPVIGVAKKPFHGNAAALGLRRGTSMNPLYVTAAGIEPGAAFEHINSMDGEHRMPTLLKLLDRETRTVRP